jgi:hypoxanthine phosphoribosyltransferase
MMDRPLSSWKGLDPDRKPVFLGYDQTERMLAVLLDRAAAWQPDVVAGIARGGVVPATMAATILALPLATIAYDRAAARGEWIGEPPAGKRVLLVDDGCSTGGTMRTVRDMMLDEGRACLTLAVVHDPEHSDFTPDLSHPMRELWRFPWERGEATPAGRAHRAAGHGPDRRTEQPFVGMEVDGVLADGDGEVEPVLPFFSDDRAAVITGRPESERARIAAWLARHGHGGLALECRPDGLSDATRVARYKADTATRIGCTHFVESEPQQAILIAALAPHLIVTWWSAERGRPFTVGAAPGAGALPDPGLPQFR